MRVPVASGHSLPQRRSFPVSKHYTYESNRRDGQSTSEVSCFYLNKVEFRMWMQILDADTPHLVNRMIDYITLPPNKMNFGETRCKKFNKCSLFEEIRKFWHT